jgi:hypothetical protein
MLDGYNIDNANVWAANPVNWIFGSLPSDDAYKGSEERTIREDLRRQSNITGHPV